MTDESTPAAAETIVKNVAEDIKKDTPGIIAHLEAFIEWDKKELIKAYEWIKSKL